MCPNYIVHFAELPPIKSKKIVLKISMQSSIKSKDNHYTSIKIHKDITQIKGHTSICKSVIKTCKSNFLSILQYPMPLYMAKIITIQTKKIGMPRQAWSTKGKL